MKKLLFIYLSVLTLSTVNAQERKESNIGMYVAAGLSMSNTFDTTFVFSSYPSLEFGIMKDNFGFGLALGRSNLSGFNLDDVSNYWYELKTQISMPVGDFSGYGIVGIGNYITTSRFFIEYGLGFSYSFKNNIGIYTQASNWDGYWYVTPGLTYSF